VVEIHLPSWELVSRRCPLCHEQHELIFYTCSSCGRIVLACCLGDTFEIANKSVGARLDERSLVALTLTSDHLLGRRYARSASDRTSTANGRAQASNVRFLKSIKLR
jgi:hypothetical protein